MREGICSNRWNIYGDEITKRYYIKRRVIGEIYKKETKRYIQTRIDKPLRGKYVVKYFEKKWIFTSLYKSSSFYIMSSSYISLFLYII